MPSLEPKKFAQSLGLGAADRNFGLLFVVEALELGKRTPTQTIFDPGYFIFGNNRFRDDKADGHGYVDLYKSIVVSCDTYYYMLANDLGIDNMARFIGQFGFGARTGIDVEGEFVGVLPSPEWKVKRFKNPAQQRWFPGETISVGIGQGYNSYTPLQLAQAVATLANDGVMYRPHFVDYIQNPIRNGTVNISDLSKLLANFDKTSGSSAVAFRLMNCPSPRQSSFVRS